MQTRVVEPADVLNDGELELRSCAPHTVCDELSLEAVEEALGHRIVVGVTDRAHRGENAIVCERLGVIDARVLGRFNWWTQRFAVGGIVDARRVLRPVCASRVSCVACC